MKIGILGAGAIGGTIGAYLKRAGHDITLIDTWPENVEAIRAKGLVVTAVEEEFTTEIPAIHLGEVSSIQPKYDAVFLAVKSYDTEWSSKFIEPYLSPGGFVVSAQNSINDDRIAEVIGWSRVVGCIVMFGGGMYEPGHVLRTSPNTKDATILGEPSGLETSRIKKLSEALTAMGPSKTTTNLWGQRWAKLGINCMSNAIAGFTGLTSAEIRQYPEVRSVSIQVTAELIKVARALGVEVEPISGIPPQMYIDALSDGEVREEVEGKMQDWAKGVGTGRPSLAQDVLKGRKTEVSELNGLVGKKGLKIGVDTPVNDAVARVGKQVERGEIAPSLDNLNLLNLP